MRTSRGKRAKQARDLARFKAFMARKRSIARLFKSALPDSLLAQKANRIAMAMPLVSSVYVCRQRDATSLSRSARAKQVRFIERDYRFHEHKATTLIKPENIKQTLASLDRHETHCLVS